MTDNPNPNNLNPNNPNPKKSIKIKVPNWIVTLLFCLASIASYHFLVRETFLLKEEPKQKLDFQEIQSLKKRIENLEEGTAQLTLNYQRIPKVSENSPDLTALKRQIDALSNERSFLTLFNIIKNRILKDGNFDKEYILLEKIVKDKNINIEPIKDISKIKNKENLIHLLETIPQSYKNITIEREGIFWDYVNKFFNLIHLRSTAEHEKYIEQALDVLKKEKLKESIAIISLINIEEENIKNKISEWLKEAQLTLYVEDILMQIQEKLEQDFLEKFKD